MLLALIAALLSSANAFAGGQFPQGFQWCVATAAHQIEGYNENSDWWDWEQIPGHIAHGDKSGAACDSWNRIEDDVTLMKDLGVSAYRFSVEWAKIEPVEGQYDQAAIEHYRHEVEVLRQNGISPIITLHHFTFPRWVRAKGGWEWPGSEESFAKYTEIVYSRIAPGSRDWITINEPMVHVMGGYFEGATPPGEHRDLNGVVPVIRGLLKAHAAAYRALHRLAEEHGVEVRVGMAHHLRTFDPNLFFNPLDDIVAYLADQGWNWTIPNAATTGKIKLHLLWYVNVDEEVPGVAGTQDFIGVNYYTGDLISFNDKTMLSLHNRKSAKKSDLGWDIYPDGFMRVLRKVAKKYPGKPILVTENGIADAKDQERPDFLRQHLTKLSQAINRGIPVEGYCHWSLIDNFEWTEGFTPRFGLYEMDYRTFKRTPRPSADLYREIIHNNGF